ncbi:hypothetical protein D3C72_1495310 [compost metagenome]
MAMTENGRACACQTSSAAAMPRRFDRPVSGSVCTSVFNLPILFCNNAKPFSRAFLICAASTYQARMPAMCSAVPGASMRRAPSASCIRGREIRLASHQINGRLSKAIGSECHTVLAISWFSGARVMAVGRCATMPQPVDGMTA